MSENDQNVVIGLVAYAEAEVIKAKDVIKEDEE
jgi:hypothetical protein